MISGATAKAASKHPSVIVKFLSVCIDLFFQFGGNSSEFPASRMIFSWF
jgi:hypothetical protein